MSHYINNMRKPYFNPSKVPEPREELVAWVDLMGTRNLMATSLKVISTAIFKLHVGALDAMRDLAFDSIFLFPVMDGFYATSDHPLQLKQFLQHVFKGLSRTFLDDKASHHLQFLIKGAIAKGKVYQGRELASGAADRLDENPDYRNSVLIGMPVVSSYLAESSAPPFGLAVHESAKSDFEISETEVWWKWHDRTFDAQGFYSELKRYFEWNLSKKGATGYKIDRIIVHDALAKKYFE